MRRVHWICVGLAIVTLLVYVRTYSADFCNYDDNDYVYENPHVIEGLTGPSVRWAFWTVQIAYWHPLTWLSHMLDVQMFGLDAGKHHATNVVYHTIASVLLFLLLRRMTGSEWRSALVAALFAWHPLHVESVAWISERKDTLSSILLLLTIYAYARFAERNTAGRYLLALLVYATALAAKPSTVTLPAILLLLDLWPLNRLTRQTFARRVLEKIPFFVLAVAVAMLTIHTQKELGVVGDPGRFTLSIRIANALVAYATYLLKMFVPTSLAVFYPHPARLEGVMIPPAHVIGAAAVLFVMTAVAIARINRRPFIFVGWFWFIITVLPMIGLVQSGVQSHADRYTYISLIGIFIAIVWSWPQKLQNLGIAVSMVVLSLCLLLTFNQTAYWHDSISLFKHAIDVVPNNYIAHNNLGIALAARQESVEAAEHFRAAIEIQPEYIDAQANLGGALIDLHQISDAEKHLRIALKLKPDHADALNNLANILAERGDAKSAEELYVGAIKVHPEVAQIHHNYAVLLASQNRSAEAIAQWRIALQLRPEYSNAQFALAKELLRSGHGAGAVARFHLSDPDHAKPADVFGWLGWVLATDPDPKVRNAAQAVQVAQRSCDLTRHSNPAALDALAAAFAEAGRFAEATETALHAADLARDQGQNEFAKEVSERAKFYNARRSFIMIPTSQRAIH